jgi:hypothetical protein
MFFATEKKGSHKKAWRHKEKKKKKKKEKIILKKLSAFVSPCEENTSVPLWQKRNFTYSATSKFFPRKVQ